MENICVCCGQIIPEGRQVCPNCENGQKPKPKPKRDEFVIFSGSWWGPRKSIKKKVIA